MNKNELIQLLFNSENIEEDIRKNFKEITNIDLENLLLQIEDEDQRIAMLDKIATFMPPDSILYIIIRIRDYDKKIKTFDKYLNVFYERNFMHMLNTLDEEKQEEFLDNHIEYFSNSNLATIFDRTYKMNYRGINRDRLLSKFIDKLEELPMALVLLNLMSYEYEIDSAVNYLLSKTNNEVTLDTIYKAASMFKSDYKVKVKGLKK